MGTRLIWATPDAEKHIMYMARVSSDNQDSSDTRLLKYLINHQHWSPFEMASMCVEIVTTRAISAQIIRHRSFNFQERSQRYAETAELEITTPRRQDLKNRQNSISDLSDDTILWWDNMEYQLHQYAMSAYRQALDKGIAKECARMLLPMSSQTKLYMSGTLRSWMHYLKLRCHESTQLEHRVLAEEIRAIFKEQHPIIGELL